MRIDVISNFPKLESDFNDLRISGLVAAVRMGMNKAAKSAKAESSRLVRETLRISKTDLDNRHLRLRLASGVKLNRLEATLKFSRTRMGAINFATDKEVQDQKGISPNRKKGTYPDRGGRRQLRFQIFNGKGTVKSRHFFKARAEGRVHVFRRGTSKGGKEVLVRATVPSVANIYDRPENRKRIGKFALDRYAIEFNRALALKLQRMKAK